MRVWLQACSIAILGVLAGCLVACQSELSRSAGHAPGSSSGAESPLGAGGTASVAPPGAGGGAGVGTGGAVPPPSAGDGTPVSVDQFVRLTRDEYQATVRQALGLGLDVTRLPIDGRIAHFTSNAAIHPDPVHPYLSVAEDLAREAIPAVLPACGAAEASFCLQEHYRAPIATLFRRPVADAELSTWATLLGNVVAAGGTPADATRTVLASALGQPGLLVQSDTGCG